VNLPQRVRNEALWKVLRFLLEKEALFLQGKAALSKVYRRKGLQTFKSLQTERSADFQKSTDGKSFRFLYPVWEGQPRIEALVNGGRNYNGPKVAKFLVG
jgi:hypothetical protein